MEQDEYDEIIRTLVRIAAHQDLINQKQDLTNQQLVLAIRSMEVTNQRLEVTLQAIKNILNRGNGH